VVGRTKAKVVRPRGPSSGVVQGEKLPPSAVLYPAGFFLLAALVFWILLSASVNDTEAGPVVALVFLWATTFAICRHVSQFSGWAVPATITFGAAVLALYSGHSLLYRPLGNPFGYSNAIGSFYMLSAAAAVMAAVRLPPAARLPLLLLAASFAAVPWLNSTTTASVLVLLLPVTLLANRRAAVRGLVVGGSALFLLAFATTIVLGLGYGLHPRDGVAQRVIEATISDTRPRLSSEALAILAANPIVGAGPGGFAQISPTARRDPVDTRWAHNELLQFGAETGVVGLLLALALLAWCFAALWWGAADRGAAVAVFSLSVLAVHTTVDYVLHFIWIGVVAAAIVGAGTTTDQRSLLRSPTLALFKQVWPGRSRTTDSVPCSTSRRG
jgi:O-antigen ligase